MTESLMVIRMTKSNVKETTWSTPTSFTTQCGPHLPNHPPHPATPRQVPTSSNRKPSGVKPKLGIPSRRSPRTTFLCLNSSTTVQEVPKSSKREARSLSIWGDTDPLGVPPPRLPQPLWQRLSPQDFPTSSLQAATCPPSITKTTSSMTLLV